MIFGDASLYLITDRKLSRGRSTLEVVEAALRGGVDVVQLRDKDAETAFVVEEGLRLHELTARYDVPLIVNDRLDVALAIEAEGAHVGQTDLPAPLARRLLPRPRLLGVSTSTVEMAQKAEQDQADYIGFGPIYATTTKQTAAAPRGPQMLAAVRRAVSLPIVVLGGITRANIADVVAAGADHVAVCSAIVGAEDVQQAASTLKDILVTARTRRKTG